jgi:drug/metabolite transporter (DMT)-like permease
MKTYAVLTIGVICISTAAVIIRLIEAPATAIAFYRLAIASIFILPLSSFLRNTNGLNQIRLQDTLMCLAASVAISIHFVAWIASLEYTSVASSVILVTTSPLIVAFLSKLFFQERLHKNVYLGIALGLIGAVVLTWGDSRLEGRELWGDLLAFIGALSFAFYLILGKRVRTRLNNLDYTSFVFLSASVMLFVISVIADQPLWSFDSKSIIFIVTLAIIPQLIGHSSITWALGSVRATLVSVAIMAEPVGAILLAWLILNEHPSLANLIGGLIILSGIFIAYKKS